MLKFKEEQRMVDSKMFLEQFFKADRPQHHKTTFTKDSAQGDMKLLLQIFTKSQLKMHTDSKTQRIHYSCKKYGGQCFELQCERLPDSQLYSLVTDYQMKSHLYKCEETGDGVMFLQIYNLIKLKKDLIEEFMHKMGLFQSPPSDILNTIEPGQHYFFEKYINYNVELRKSLRKRFDNVVNIDIKKIMKGGKEKEESVGEKPRRKKYEECQQKGSDKSTKRARRQSKEDKEICRDSNIFEESQSRDQFLGSALCDRGNKVDQRQPKKTKLIQKQPKQTVRSQFKQNIASQAIFYQDQDDILPEIKQLNKQPQLHWQSSSESSESAEIPMSNFGQDYLLSLRNSNLQKSLQKESLNTIHILNLWLSENKGEVNFVNDTS